MEQALEAAPAASDASVLRDRRSQLQATVAQNGWAAALVLDPLDILYLCGLSSSNAALVITPQGYHIATDSRYANAARELAPDATVHQVDQSLYDALGSSLSAWVGEGAVAYEPTRLTHRAFLQLTEHIADGITLRASDGIVARQRLVKDERELAAMRSAARLLEGAFELVSREGIVGRSERDVLWMIERFLRESGAERMSFDGIVAGGINGASPHHHTSDAIIPADTLVTIDIGCVVDSYCSDCTRTFATGANLPGELRAIYEVTLQAQRAGLAAVRAGARGADVDGVARTVIEQAGHGEAFGHGLGHGVGLNIHEPPRLSRTSNDVLEIGNVVTVEPGIYLPGVGGVRIEDEVVVRDGEPEVLTGFTKELLTIA